MPFIALLMFSLVLQGSIPEPAAIIRGRITDAVTGAPVARATVVLVLPAGTTKTTRADDSGQYEFRDVAPGTYRVSAQAAEFRATHVPTEFSDPAQPANRSAIALKAGDVRARVDIALRRSVAISGRVVDEWGQPIAGMPIGAGTRFAPRGAFPGGDTDDRGEFRVFGLAPGRYFVCTDPRAGRARMMIGLPPRARSLPTCYPSATKETDALRVAVGQADVDGVEIRLVRGRTFNISGTVVDSQGAPPARATVELKEWEEGRSGGSLRSLPSDGRFALKDLLPGEYVVAAKTGALGDDSAPGESAHVRIRIDDSDVEGVSLALVRTVRVRGRLVFESETAPIPPGSGYRVTALPADLIDVPNVSPSTAVKPDLTFELTGIDGPSTIAMSNVPAGWVVQSVKYKGREITDSVTPLVDSGETLALEILLSRRGGTLSGTVLDDSGAPATGSRVLLFPADSAKWRTSPPARSVFASSKGRFEFEARRAGEYLVAAVSAEEIPRFPKAEFFDRLAKVAERVVLGEGERRSIDLRVVKVPEDR